MLVKLIGLIIVLVWVLAVPDAGFSEEAQPSISLTLKDAISIALKKNLSIEEEAILFKMAEADIKVKEGEFDPALNLQLTESYIREQTVPTLMSEEEKASKYSVSLGGKIKTGTAYELKWSGERIRKGENPFLSLNSYYSSGLTFSITQPLLKGRGTSIQESSLRVSRNALKVSELKTELKAIEIISETANAYWNLYFFRSNYEALELSLRLTESVLEEVKVKISKGLLPQVEVYKADAEVAKRKEELLKAKVAMLKAEDSMRAVMNLQDWQKEILLLESLPEPKATLPDLDTLLSEAFSNRRDYKSALIEQKSKMLMRRFYENQRLPEFNVIAGTGLNGVAGGYRDSLDELQSGNYYSWQVGITFILPIGNRTAKGNALRARLDEEKANVSLMALRQKITVELREAIRGVEFAEASIKAAGATKTASEMMLNAEQTRFTLGMATLNDVLSFQTEYTQALSSEKKAVTDYAISLISLEKTKGTLLEWYKTH